MATDAETAPLSSSEICRHLRTKVLGRALHVYEEVDSTNRAAFSLADAGSSSGTVVAADAQTAGRGRLSRVWHSPPRDNLYCSILLAGNIAADHLSTWLCWLPLVTGIGVLTSIQTVTGLKAALKWPNDVLINGRKVAGILCESTGVGTAAARVVVGVGVNVNALRESFPAELREYATSLAMVAGRRFSRAELLATLLNDLEPRYAAIAASIPQVVVQEYASHCSTLGRKVRIALASGELLDGVAHSLSSTGALSVVQAGTNQSWTIHAGDVVHVR